MAFPYHNDTSVMLGGQGPDIGREKSPVESLLYRINETIHDINAETEGLERTLEPVSSDYSNKAIGAEPPEKEAAGCAIEVTLLEISERLQAHLGKLCRMKEALRI